MSEKNKKLCVLCFKIQEGLSNEDFGKIVDRFNDVAESVFVAHTDRSQSCAVRIETEESNLFKATKVADGKICCLLTYC